MPFDAVFLRAVRQELETQALGARVDKIHQPTRDSVLLQLRGRSGGGRLLITVNPGYPRVHFTQMATENPAQPPMFCMLLRKHLQGGKLTALRQPPMERCLELCFDCTDELGAPVEKRLIVEIMGRNSNLILTGDDGRILDCIRRVDFTMSEKRPVLPGLYYALPPQQGKRNPAETGAAELETLLRTVDHPCRLADWLMEQFAGLPPLICRELSFRLLGQTDAALPAADAAGLAQGLAEEFARLAGPYTPVLLRRADGRPLDYTYRPIAQYEGSASLEEYPDFSALLDAYYAVRDTADRLRQKAQSLHKTVSTRYDRVTRKLALQEKELEATFDRERLRQLGDIVTANLYQMERGQIRLTAVDFYDPEMRTVDIPLNPAISPQQNAAKFYKDYAKAKNAEKFLTQQLARGREEQKYLASILDELARAESERDIQEIRAELVAEGYVRETGGKRRMKLPPSRPMEFRSSDGFPILVGRNNRQNDQLTLKTAARSDLWLHVQKLHGSHVIILCGGTTPPDSTVTEAMQLAAYYSQARQGQGVAVDYAPVRQVKKPAGAKPGMVVYEHYQTGYVTPDPTLPERLRVQN